MQVNAASCHSKFEVNPVMAEKLFNALKAIEALPSGAMKVYGLLSGQGLDRRNDMARACGSGHIIPSVQVLALGQSINLHSALSSKVTIA